MSMQDPIADMLTRVRNAQLMGIQTVTMPHSTIKCGILSVLQEGGFIGDFNIQETGNKKDISVSLKYHQGQRVIEKIKRISKPALRVYKGSRDLPVIRGGLGLVVVSTSKGVMSAKAAQAQGLGGEILCTVE